MITRAVLTFLLRGITIIIIGLSPVYSFAQDQSLNANAEPPIVITLDEAVQIAMLRNLEIQNTRLDLDMINSQITEGYSELYPQIEFASSYTRNMVQVNPFTGSSAGGFFSSLGLVDWLAFNEQSRTDGDPDTSPIPMEEYFLRQEQGIRDAGVQVQRDTNPFAIPNQFRTGFALTQKLFDARVIFGAKGAKKWLPPFTSAGILRQEQLLVDDVKRVYYRTRLVEEEIIVTRQSVERARKTRDELARQVALGVLPKFQRLSAEVELANVETDLVEVENRVEASKDALKLLLGVKPNMFIVLRGSLDEGLRKEFIPSPINEAVAVALNSRPDLEQARINVELEKVQYSVAKTEFYPDLSAFLNVNYLGNVPDSRTILIQDQDDPFSYTSTELAYFSPFYWGWDMNGGFRLSWNLFNGFATTERVQQRMIAIEKAELGREYLYNSIQLEVERALRDVAAADRRMQSQEKNVANAELNYTFVDARLREGVASPIELREASDQLDQSRLNFLRAVHDYLVSITAYETAIGAPTNQLIQSSTLDVEQ